MRKIMSSIKMKADTIYKKTIAVLKDNRGEGFVDKAVSILISIVIGALLLAGLYLLFGDVVLPTITQRIQEMFNYKG